MITYVTAYAAAFVAFVAADMVWLGLMVNRVYRPALGDILIPGVNLPPAIIFYLLFPVGLLIFAVLPALKSEINRDGGGLWCAVRLLHLRNLRSSNYATLRNWTVQVTAIDMAWGTVLGAIAALVAYLVTAKVAGTG